MTGNIYGPLPAGTTVNHSRWRTTIRFERGGTSFSIVGGDIYFTGNRRGRRRSGGRNRGQGVSSSLGRCFLDGLIPYQNNRQRHQRRHETQRPPQRAEGQLQHPSQPNPSARTANPSLTSMNTENAAEKSDTSNPPMDDAKPSFPTNDTEGSRAAKNTWGGPMGAAGYEASPSTGMPTEIGSFMKTAETSQQAQTTNTISPK